MTLSGFLKEKTDLLARNSVTDAETEAWIVLETVSGMSRAMIRFSMSKALAECFSDDIVSRLEDVFRRRAEGEPLAYIVGHAPFYDLEFSVGEGVLIPRFDTEILVETALTSLRVDDLVMPPADAPIPRVFTEAPFTVYDLCTGSGIVGITIAHELQKRHIPYKLVMTDISETAAFFAKKNAEAILGENAAWTVEIADLWPATAAEKAPASTTEGARGTNTANPAPNTSRADIIVCNPPYITKNEMEELSVEVREHEPHLALTDGGDGLSFYKRIFTEIGNYIKDGGVIAVEHGYNQSKDIRDILPDYITDVVCVKDYGDNDRVTCGRYERPDAAAEPKPAPAGGKDGKTTRAPGAGGEDNEGNR